MQIVSDRRALHAIPELDRDLPKTLAYLRQALSGLNCRVFSPMEGALCAYFDFGADRAIAFRSDADALPIQEKTGAAYASTHPGQMHACGHDGHMAVVLELARRLSGKTALSRNVLLLFQPAEETTGGAKDLCAAGLLEAYHVEAVFALHLWPGLEAGVLASRKREMMARSCEVTVTITGKSAHIAKAWEGVDALAAGVEFYRAVKEMEQALPAEDFRVLNFGRMESGQVRNAISGETKLEGTLRAFRDEVFFALQAGIRQAAEATASASGCAVEVAMGEGYPAVWNPEALYDKVQSLVSFRELEAPSLITEDFSWYQRFVPGMFFFLGTGDSPALHADTFDFPEDILMKGADFFEKLAERYQ